LHSQREECFTEPHERATLSEFAYWLCISAAYQSTIETLNSNSPPGAFGPLIAAAHRPSAAARARGPAPV